MVERVEQLSGDERRGIEAELIGEMLGMLRRRVRRLRRADQRAISVAVSGGLLLTMIDEHRGDRDADRLSLIAGRSMVERAIEICAEPVSARAMST